jgi:hypothetical protein
MALVCCLLAAGCDDARYGSAVRDAGGRDLATDPTETGPEDAGRDTEAEVAPDVVVPGGNVRFEINNAGDLPVYLAPVIRSDSWFGISVYDENGEQVIMELPCAARCDSCQDVACEPPERRVRQLLPGESLTLDWNGAWAMPRSCELDGRQVGCVEYERPPAGRYEAHFCFSTLLAPDPAGARRRRDDTLVSVDLGPLTCVVKPFELRERGAWVMADLVGDPVDKAFGYCGQAWEYDRRAVPEFSGEIPPAAEGGSVAVPVSLVRPDELCGEWGWMSWVERDRTIALRAGAWLGTRACRSDLYVYLLDPLVAGSWRAVITTLIDFMPEPVPFEVEACDGCGQCPEPEVVEIGGTCRGDCACSDGARCIGGLCTLYCRSNRDCRPDTLCSAGRVGEPIPSARRCRARQPDECAQNQDCAPGSFCQGDANFSSRCLPDLDKRFLTGEAGRSLHCGCDAECPGAQSCVRFEVNFTQGFCALRCSDQRDCPKNWSCLGETASGLESICVR